MKIIFLDASTLHTGELDLSPLQSLAPLTCYPTSSVTETLTRVTDADIIITNKAVISAEIIAAAPQLKLIVSCATGVNQIDLGAAKSAGITVSNVAGYSTNSVAQHVFTFILNFATQIPKFTSESHQWPTYPTFTSLAHPCLDLAGKTLGIAGIGSIGSATARIALAFGMHVQVLSRKSSSAQNMPELPRVSANTFFSTSDFISLHCPLTDSTAGMINKNTLEQMKPSAFLVNTGRGPLINEVDLADALAKGTIAGAGLDVLSSEPPSPENPLILCQHPQLSITPHTAWSTIEARQRLLAGVTSNIKTFLAGSPANKVI